MKRFAVVVLSICATLTVLMVGVGSRSLSPTETFEQYVNLRMDGPYPQEIEITRIDPDLPVRSAVLLNPERFQGTATPFCHISPTMDDRVSPGAARIDTPWFGFASTRRYLEYAARAGA